MDTSPLNDTKVLFLFLEVIRKIIKKLRKTFYDGNEWLIFVNLMVSNILLRELSGFSKLDNRDRVYHNKTKGWTAKEELALRRKEAIQGEADKQ